MGNYIQVGETLEEYNASPLHYLLLGLLAWQLLTVKKWNW